MGDRACRYCGTPLPPGTRPHAVVCSNTCRADLSRLRRLLAGDPVDGYANVAAFISTRYRHARSPGNRIRNASERDPRRARGNG